MKNINTKNVSLCAIEEFIDELYDLYSKRTDIYVPLSTYLPKHWSNLFYTSVKKVLFKRFDVKNFNEKPHVMWVLTYGHDRKTAAKAILENYINLVRMVYSKYNWHCPFNRWSYDKFCKTELDEPTERVTVVVESKELTQDDLREMITSVNTNANACEERALHKCLYDLSQCKNELSSALSTIMVIRQENTKLQKELHQANCTIKGLKDGTAYMKQKYKDEINYLNNILAEKENKYDLLVSKLTKDKERIKQIRVLLNNLDYF